MPESTFGAVERSIALHEQIEAPDPQSVGHADLAVTDSHHDRRAG